MRRFITHISILSLFCTTVSSYALGDPLQEQARERRRIIPPPQPVQQAPQPAYARERQVQQQLREGGMAQNGSSGGGTLSQPRVVSIDRLKMQSDSPAEYQFEQLQTLTISENEPLPVEEEKPEPVEAIAEEPPSEQPADEVAAAESDPEEALEEAAAEEELTDQAVVGNTKFRIIEENNRIIVMQVETTPNTGSQTP